jgi:MYXO-CTERM domain-containing protein
MRKLALRFVLPLSMLGLLLVASRPALAIEVMCTNAFGECTVSNDGFDSIECLCNGEGFGGTGGDQYTDLTEDELLQVCIDQLVFCEGGNDTSTDGGGTGTSDTGVDPTGDGDGDGDGGDTAMSGDGDGDTGGNSTGDGDGDGDLGDGDGDSGDGDGDSAGDSGDGDGDAGDGDGDSAGDTNSDDGSNADESGDGGETSTGSDAGAAEGDSTGCACNVTNHAPGVGLMLLSMLGLLGLRRRDA